MAVPVSATRTAVTLLALPKVASQGSACEMAALLCQMAWYLEQQSAEESATLDKGAARQKVDSWLSFQKPEP